MRKNKEKNKKVKRGNYKIIEKTKSTTNLEKNLNKFGVRKSEIKVDIQNEIEIEQRKNIKTANSDKTKAKLTHNLKKIQEIEKLR